MKDAPEEGYFGESLVEAVAVRVIPTTRQAAAYAHNKTEPLDTLIPSLYGKERDDIYEKGPDTEPFYKKNIESDSFYLILALSKKVDEIHTILTTPKKRGRPVGTKGIKKRKTNKKVAKNANRHPVRRK